MAKPPGKRPTQPKKAAAKSKLQKVQIAPSAKEIATKRRGKADRRGTPAGKGTIKANGGRIGNPKHEPTDKLRTIAETHAAVGSPHWVIAAEMGISEDTLERHYSKELAMGLHRMNARVGSSIAKKALDGDADMQKFWMARRGGPAWANKNQTELSTPPGRPIETRDMSGLSDAQLAALATLDEKPA